MEEGDERAAKGFCVASLESLTPPLSIWRGSPNSNTMKTGTLIKIAIVGPESSGKTFLAENLAAHYNCLWVPEYARGYLEKFTQPYTQADVEIIAKGQIKTEDSAAAQSASHPERSRRMLICDTNLLVIKIWMEDKYGNTLKWIEEEIMRRKYHLHLLTAPDIPYADDPLRENPERGEYFFEKYEQLLLELKLPYKIISEKKRVETAIEEIGKLI